MSSYAKSVGGAGEKRIVKTSRAGSSVSAPSLLRNSKTDTDSKTTIIYKANKENVRKLSRKRTYKTKRLTLNNGLSVEKLAVKKNLSDESIKCEDNKLLRLSNISDEIKTTKCLRYSRKASEKSNTSLARFSNRPLKNVASKNLRGCRSCKPRMVKALSAKKKDIEGRSIGSKTARASVHFKRCKTFRSPRISKYPQRSIQSRNRLDCFHSIKYSMTSEGAMRKVEHNNTLIFIVQTKASKNQIKSAVKKLYDIDALKMNSLLKPDRRRKDCGFM